MARVHIKQLSDEGVVPPVNQAPGTHVLSLPEVPDDRAAQCGTMIHACNTMHCQNFLRFCHVLYHAGNTRSAPVEWLLLSWMNTCYNCFTSGVAWQLSYD